MLCNSHPAVEKIRGYPQANMKICFAPVLHRKFLHNPQGLCKNKIDVTAIKKLRNLLTIVIRMGRPLDVSPLALSFNAR